MTANRVAYRCIVVDPPWEYDQFVQGPSHGVGRLNVPLPYGGMSLEQIEELPIPTLAEKAAWLFLWTTNRYLPDAFGLLSVWGFRYRQTIIWRKTGDPTPFAATVAPNHAEYLLCARRGSCPRTGVWPSNVIDAPATPHSQKPDVFLDMIEQVAPGPRLELFARRQRLGWDTWGDQALEHVELPA